MPRERPAALTLQHAFYAIITWKLSLSKSGFCIPPAEPLGAAGIIDGPALLPSWRCIIFKKPWEIWVERARDAELQPDVCAPRTPSKMIP